MPQKPETIISALRITAAMGGHMPPEEIAVRALVLGIVLDQRDPELAKRLLAVLPDEAIALLQPVIDAVIEADDAV